MQTFNRICIKDWVVKTHEDDSFTNGVTIRLKRGEEYLTSAVDDDQNVTVFSSYWFSAPVSIFAGEIEFTPK